MFDLRSLIKKEHKDLIELKNEFENYFHRFFDRESLLSRVFLREGEFVRRVDVSEGKKEIAIKAEIPGYDAKDINVHLNGRILIIKGEKKKKKKEKDQFVHHIEHTFGCFSRALELPKEVDQENIDAAYKDDVLTLVFKKTKEAKSQQIEIKTG